MDWPDTAAQIAILWTVTVLMLAWRWLPAACAALGASAYRFDVREIAPDAPATEAPDCKYWHDRILAAGHEPLAQAVVRMYFAGPTWAINAPARIYLNSTEKRFALLQQVPAPYSFWPNCDLLTIWDDDRLLLTDNNRDQPPDPDSEFIRQGTITLEPAKLRELHDATVTVLKQYGGRVESHADVFRLKQSMETHVGPIVKRVNGKAGTDYLFLHGLVHLCASIPTAVVAGMGHWSVPLTNLVLGAIMILGERMQQRRYGQLVREAFRAKLAGETHT